MKQPNILLINCDDMGYGDLGCYGSAVNKTPTIDALVREGMRFTSFYAASPVCSPSRAALMTGCYPPRVGINTVLFPGDAEGLDPAECTLGRALKDAGYATKLVGKWHIGDQPGSLPRQFGFDEYFGLPYSNDMGVQKGKTDFKRYPPLPLMKGGEVLEEQPDQRDLTQRYVEECVSFINKNADRPFFLYLAHMHVHLPLYAPDEFVTRSANGDYGACVEEVDWACAELLRTIRERGLEENTLVLFTSDNGSRGDHGASNAPLRGGKHTSWEGGARVPMIAYWKGRIPAGCTNANIACNIDILPTLASITGAKGPEKPIDGVNIEPMLYDGSEARRDTMVYFGAHPKGSYLCAVRKGKWKLHACRRGEAVHELYDLEADIGEEKNLYGMYPDIEAELNELYESYRYRLGDLMTGATGAETRPCLKAENPRTLTVYDPDHPYIVAMYDKPEAG